MEAIKLELSHFVREKFLLFMCFVMPLFCAIFIYATLDKSLVRELPVGIVDFDDSKVSRDIIFNIDASPTMRVERAFSSLKDAKDSIAKKEIYAAIVLPKNLAKNAKMGVQSTIPIYYNAELVFIGKNIQSAMTQIVASANVTLKFSKNIATSTNTTLAMGRSVDFMPQIIALYNPNSDFMAFILPALIPCLWQLFIILCMIGFMAYDERDVGHIENKRHKIAEKFGDGAFYAHLGVKVALNTAIFFAWWCVFMVSFLKLGIIAHLSAQNFATLALNALITIMAYNAIGIFLYALIGSHTRSISIAAVYAAPSLAFVGITYPINNMVAFANFWSKILPITKYLEVYMQQVNYGLQAADSARFIAYNLIFLLFGILGILIYKKKSALRQSR